MIDWLGLAVNALWVLGLALALATLSFASWQASLSGAKLRQHLERAAVQIWLDISGVLFCAGLAATARRWWEIALWAALAVAFAAQAVSAYLAERRTPSGIARPTDTDSTKPS